MKTRIDAPSNGQTTLSFDVTGGSNLPLALIAWTENPVNVTYIGTGDLNNPITTTSFSTPTATSTPSATASTTKKSGSEKALVPLGMVFLFSIFVLVM
jgi:hypothetical protein